MKCEKCGRTITKKSKFCPYCGTLVTPKTGSKKEVSRSSFSVGYAVIFIGIGIILGYSIFKFTSTSQPNSVSSSFQKTLPVQSAAVLDIAREFMCPCGSCNDSLDDCTCDMPRGAVEVKSFIAQKLQENHKRAHIIEMVQEKYGGLKSSSNLRLR